MCVVAVTSHQSSALRPCRLYRFCVEHPLTGETVLGYVGETGRQPFERLLEHLATQPWFDTVVRWEVDPRTFYGKDAVLRAETAAIRAERPLYNVKGNESNDARIIPPDAIRQRRARDAATNATRWVHPADRVPAAPRPLKVPATKPARRWRPWQKRLVGWPSVWLGLTLALWAWFVFYGLVASVLAAGETAAGTAFALTAWVASGAPIPLGKWKRRARRIRKRLW